MSVSPVDVPASPPAHQTQPAAQPLRPAAAVAPGAQASSLGKSRGGLWRKLILLLLLAALGVFIYRRVQSNKAVADEELQKTAAAADRAIPVTVSPVASRTMPIYFTALGTVTAYNSVTIKSRVDGQLLSVNVREGQQVRQGQLLAVIDPRPYEASLAQANGQLSKDEATARNAEAEANRYRALYQAGVVSQESAQSQAANSGQSVGALEADRAAIQAAKVNVAYTRITSPINGVVGLRQVDPGNIVHAADATGLILVTQLQPIAVIFTLPEDQLPAVLKLMRAGNKLAVEALDRNESAHLAVGTLLTVDNMIDTTTGTVKGKAVFDNRDGALFPNQFVNVRLVLEQRQNSLVIPASALQTGTQGNFVYVVKPCPPSGCPKPDNPGGNAAAAGKPKSKGKGSGAASSNAGGSASGANAAAAGGADSDRKPSGPQYYVDIANVVVDLTEGSQVILKSGVNPGDQVVIDGQEKLKPRSKVKPVAGAPSSPAAAGNGNPRPGSSRASGALAPDAESTGKSPASPSTGTGAPTGTPR